MQHTAVTIPGGFRGAARWERSLWARTLCGSDELFLAEEARAMPPAARTTALLERTIALDGGAIPAGRGFCRDLAVGDREALLLQLRRLTFGGGMCCILFCPSCGEKLDLDLDTSALLLPPYAGEAGGRDGSAIAENGERYSVRIRRLTGADQEDLSEMAGSDPDAAELCALRRCVVEAHDSAGQVVTELPAAALRNLSSLLAEMDPQAELNLEATCPACGAVFTRVLDAMRFLESEISQDLDVLYAEIHRIASHYHWSEAEILAMPAARRKRYLGLIANGGRVA